MGIRIHPSASDNFNKKAGELLGLVKELPTESSRQAGFPSDLYVAASISEKDIVGDVDTSLSDYQGNTIDRFFYLNGRKFGLGIADYKSLKETAERLQSLPVIRSTLSVSFIEKTLFSWICNKYQGVATPESFVEYLDKQAQKIIKTRISWIPIANLEVQTPFPISRSEIRQLSKAVIDKWGRKIASLSDGNQKEAAIQYFETIRRKYQGLASVVTVIDAEPEFASDYAIEEAQKITAVLGIFSDATLIPDVKCVSKIKGSENIAQATVFFESGDDGFQMESSTLDRSSSANWRLSQSNINEIREMGLDKISSLLAADSLKDFEKSVLNSIFLYSKSAFTADPVEKIVYILASLESVMLKNANEPIQQNLAERVAVFTARELKVRKFIIKTIKSVYGIRSKYLHHGHVSSELELVSDFMIQVRMFFIKLLANVDLFRTQEQFVNAIDDHKLA